MQFRTVYIFGDTNDQIDTLNKLILIAIDKHETLIQTKFTSPPFPSIKDVNHLQCNAKHWLHETQKSNKQKMVKRQRS